MTSKRWIAIWAAFALLAFPALSVADHHIAGEESAEHPANKAGGKAAEHRSEKAAENSNAQWDEDNEGRPEKLRGDDDEDGHEDAEHEGKEKQDKKDKKGKKDKGPQSKD